MKYKVFYSNGTKYEHGNGKKPHARDVQVIVQEHADIGWHTQSGYAFYVWREEQGRWVGVDKFGLYDFLLDTGLVLFGRTLTTPEFNEVMTRAVKELGDSKLGWLKDEKH